VVAARSPCLHTTRFGSQLPVQQGSDLNSGRTEKPLFNSDESGALSCRSRFAATVARDEFYSSCVAAVSCA